MYIAHTSGAPRCLDVKSSQRAASLHSYILPLFSFTIAFVITVSNIYHTRAPGINVIARHTLLLRPQQRWRTIVMSTSMCVCVCLSVREHISRTTRAIFTKFCAHVACHRGSVLLRRGDAISRGRDNFGGFLPHWKCSIWAVLRYEFCYEGPIWLKFTSCHKVGQNSRERGRRGRTARNVINS